MLTLLDISEIRSIIQKLNSYNLLTGKVAEKISWTLYRPNKKTWKEYWRVAVELFIKDNIKALKYKSCLNFCACQKKFLEFTDSTNTIYWLKNRAKNSIKLLKKIFLYMSVLNTFQYTQCLCILTLSKCNE